MKHIDTDEVAWRRFARSGLLAPWTSPVEAASRLVGVQSQFLPPSGLALANRLAEPLHADDLDRLLNRERTLLRLWGQRRTVHVYDTRDWPTIVALSRSLPDYRTRIVDLLDRTEAELDDALARVEAHLEREGRACRADIVAADAGLEPWFRFGTGIMMDLVRRGTVCHAGLEGGRSYFAHRSAWLPELPWSPPTADEAGADLARRYYAAYGPATEADFVFWTGARAADARRWVEDVRRDLTSVSVEGVEMLEAGSAPEPGDWPFLMLHRFDPLLLAHKDKSWIVDETRYKAVWRKAGYVEAVLLRRGRVVGTWAYRKKGRALDVELSPFGRLTKRERRACDRKAEWVAAHLGLRLKRVSEG